jgi:DnaK suppressor protein
MEQVLCWQIDPKQKYRQVMTGMDLDHMTAIIEREIDALKQLSETTKPSRAPVMLDQQSVGRLSRMDALQQQSMELATEERRQQRLLALTAALRRIEAGDYGFCLKCDGDIASGRLAVDPAVTLCIDCA